MREALALFLGAQVAVEATLSTSSSIHGYAGRHDTVLCLVHVQTVDGEVLTDHVWIRRGRRLRALDLHKGDRVAFTGTVVRYTHVNGDPDYKLVRPYQCRVLERAPLPAPKPEPAPILALTLDETPSASARLLQAIQLLGAATGKSPSLPTVCQYAGLTPWSVVSHLYKLAKDGRVAFKPNGRIANIPSTTMEGASL